MGRLARVVLPGVVHHITQSGVRSMNIFSGDEDRRKYLTILKERADEVGLQFIGYCLMNNHVHLLAIPSEEDSLRRGIGEAHRLYSQYVNSRAKVRGHLFQGRFFSCPLNDQYFLDAAHYVEKNPVRARICKKAEQYHWSSARFNLGLTKDDLLIEKRDIRFNRKRTWIKRLLADPTKLDTLRLHFRTGRPLGSESFLMQAELLTGRTLIPKQAGRPRNRS